MIPQYYLKFKCGCLAAIDDDRIANTMPTFKKIKRVECESIIIPDNFPHSLEAKFNDTKKDEYHINTNYLSGRSFKFKILIKDETNQPIDLSTYALDWKLINIDKPLEPVEPDKQYIHDFNNFVFGFPIHRLKSNRVNEFYLKIPWVISIGNHQLLIRIFRNRELICNWEKIAQFEVLNADLDSRDKQLVLMSVILGAIFGIIGSILLFWITGQLK